MTLYIIGLGLGNEKDITLRGLETIKKCDKVYLESYTSLLQCNVEDLEFLYNKKIIVSNRELVESKAEETILSDSKEGNVAFLVIGDPFGATTHLDIVMRAREEKIPVEIIHNVSILTAVGVTGLELYKFGKTTSLPYPEKGFKPLTYYDVIKQNQSNGLHTLILLDIKADKQRFMSVKEALHFLLEAEEEKKQNGISKDLIVVGCARLGSDTQLIKAGTIQELLKIDFGKPPHCVIIPGDLHFKEEEALEFLKNKELIKK